jgi:hypothetical protein
MNESFNESAKPMIYAVIRGDLKEGSPEWKHEKRHEWQEKEWGAISFIAQQEFWSLSATAIFLLIYHQLNAPYFLGMAEWTFFYYFIIMFSIEMDAVMASMTREGRGFIPVKPDFLKKKEEKA